MNDKLEEIKRLMNTNTEEKNVVMNEDSNWKENPGVCGDIDGDHCIGKSLYPESYVTAEAQDERIVQRYIDNRNKELDRAHTYRRTVIVRHGMILEESIMKPYLDIRGRDMKAGFLADFIKRIINEADGGLISRSGEAISMVEVFQYFNNVISVYYKYDYSAVPCINYGSYYLQSSRVDIDFDLKYTGRAGVLTLLHGKPTIMSSERYESKMTYEPVTKPIKIKDNPDFKDMIKRLESVVEAIDLPPKLTDSGHLYSNTSNARAAKLLKEMSDRNIKKFLNV